MKRLVLGVAIAFAIASCEDENGDGDAATDPIDAGRRDARVVRPDSGPACPDPAVLPALDLLEVGAELVQPIYVTQPPGVTDALYAAEKWGRIVIVRDGAAAATFLDLRTVVTGAPGPDFPVPENGDERGLLGLAFHPDYADNGRFFVYYAPFGPADNQNDRRMLLEEYQRSADPDRAEPAPVRSYLEDGEGPAGMSDPAENHNGGMIEFWPRSGGGPYYLYLGVGDGGGGCDEWGEEDGNAQDRGSIFGKIHRLDIDGAPPHAAAGNPFTGAGELRSIWVYGLRNPWRFSFDRDNGDLYIGDVGQGSFEEIDYIAAGESGYNFGWRHLEGDCSSAGMSRCESDYPAETCLAVEEQAQAGYIAPVYPEPRSGGVLGFSSAIIGGYIYRGNAIPQLRGWYLFGDYASDRRAAMRVCSGRPDSVQEVPGISGDPGGVVSFGEDNAGELYMVSQSGSLWRIVSP